MPTSEPFDIKIQVTVTVTNPSPTLVHNLYLSAPHSMHADPNYFPWCDQCHPPALRPCPDPDCCDYPMAKCFNCGRWTHDHTIPQCYLC